MKKYLGHISFLLLLGLVLFLYSFSANRNQAKKVKDIAVEFVAGDNAFLTHAMVNKLLIQNQKTVKNQTKRVLDLHSLEGNVLSNPYVEEATVFLTIDGLLKTMIKQREPIARIQSEQGAYYIDKHGVEIPLSNNYSARVPLVSGVETAEEIKELRDLMITIGKDDFLNKEIVGIQKRDQEYKFNVRSGTYQIVFGPLKNVRLKFLKLKAFYNKAFTDKTIHNYKTINLKYHNQVVCTK